MEKKIAIIMIICCNMIYAQNINYFYNQGERQFWTVDSTTINLIVVDTTDLPWIYQNAIDFFHGDAEGYYSDEDDNLVINSRSLNSINMPVYLYFITEGHPEKIKYYTYAKNIQDERVLFRNEIAVKLKNPNNINTVLSIIQDYSVSNVEIEDSVFLYIVCDTESDLIMLANQLYESGLTHYSEPDFYMNYEYYYNDPYYGQQYYLHNTGQSITLIDNSVFHCIAGIDLKTVQAWNFISNIQNLYSTKVAIVDDGVEDHEDLTKNGISKVLHGFPAINHGRPKKCHAHGQCCAGIIAAASNNNKGIVGIDGNADIVPVRIFKININGESVHMSNKRIARGIRKSWEEYESDILNVSWGSITFVSQQILDAFQIATTKGRNDKGCVVVAASGNDFNTNKINIIAEMPEVLAVGAIKGDGSRGEYSNYNSDLNVVAFGWETLYQQGTDNAYSDVYTIDREGRRGYNQNQNGNYYAYFGMTSAAAPMVSGVASLMLSVNPDLTSGQVKDIIERTAQKLNGYLFEPASSTHPNGTWNEKIGYGLVDAHKAVVYAYMFGQDDISLSIDEPITCNTITCSCDINHSELFTYEWSCSSNLTIVEQNGMHVTLRPLSSGSGTVTVKVLSYGRTMYTKQIAIDLSTVLSISLQPIAISPITITNNIQWSDNNMLLPTTLMVDSLATLTITGTLYSTPGARLIIRPGGKLIVDGGKLTSACPNEMWQGIEVVGDRTKRQLPQHQGVVELRNGATIENALCGIRTGLREDTVNFATTGGIITADSATFRNNRQAVVINSYAGLAPSGVVADNQCLFEKCTFVVDANNLFAANNTAFAEHVRLWDVKWVKFLGCHFRNEINNSLVYNGRGIYACDAGMKLDVKCAHDNVVLPGYCGCPPTLSDSCEFSGFATAVEVIAGNNPYAVMADRVKFRNNATGMCVNANNYVTVTRCDFDLTSNPQELRYLYGLYLSGCSGFKVESNQFDGIVQYVNGITTGIYVNGSGSPVNKLYKNLFNNLTYGIRAYGNNSGLQIQCNEFDGSGVDIFVPSGSSVASSQGSLQTSAGNKFIQAHGYNISNGGAQAITYYYKNSTTNSNAEPVLNSGGVSVIPSNTANNCASTLCNNGGPVYPLPLAGFQSGMNAYTTALAGNTDTDGMGNADGAGVETQNFSSQQQALSDTYYTAVRTLMSDSLLDLAALEQWHTAAQPIADPYSLTETRFMEGYAESFAADVDDAEMANYAEFHAMKLVLRNHDGVETQNFASLQPGDRINWYALTPAQIAQLQTIAERNTGRASVMAKGVLCFFFDICYEDGDLLADEDGDADAETRAKHTAINTDDDAALAVYPNPTDDILHIELAGAEIANIALYDLQGRVVTGVSHTPARTGGTATVDVKSVPAGVYVLRVTDADGKEHHRKIVKR